MDNDALKSAVESILFVADRPVTVERLQEVFGEEGPKPEEFKEVLQGLQQRYQEASFGFELREAQGGYQFCTKVPNANLVQRFQQTKPFRVGRSALETLAIIAYRQPITRAEIDSVRGIDSSHLLRVLIERGLVKMVGKAEVPGRPVQYGTTPKFLETVGLKTIGELPPLTELNQLQGDTEDPMKRLEEGLERFVADQTTHAERLQATEGLGEIETLIHQAESAPKEVYDSKEAAEVALENEAALAAFQSTHKPVRRRKQTIKFEELTTMEPLPTLESDKGETLIN